MQNPFLYDFNPLTSDVQNTIHIIFNMPFTPNVNKHCYVAQIKRNGATTKETSLSMQFTIAMINVTTKLSISRA